MPSTSIRSRSWVASHSSSKRLSISVIDSARASSGERSRSSCSGYDGPPTPPGEVQFRASRSTRSGTVTAISWATMPPKLVPTTRQVSQPRWSMRAMPSAA